MNNSKSYYKYFFSSIKTYLPSKKRIYKIIRLFTIIDIDM